MKTAKAFGLVLAGVAIGVVAAGAPWPLRSLQAAQRTVSAPTRVTATYVSNKADRQMGFLKDTRSGGCWLYVSQSPRGDASGTDALAVAPPTACD